ncbi:hypothetical protein TNIN_137931 [Trichonephila inaurata madagascariensis]|uniref:Uncharacterized protein n=1 Tax=Trichonephila inaurata madagascariensis TaxID=2747483 RepID=A0A8X6X0T8_9ARAC|nr:hypothetical protein TNIN_137931 [Trichonephila inaurata madagascariensis]
MAERSETSRDANGVSGRDRYLKACAGESRCSYKESYPINATFYIPRSQKSYSLTSTVRQFEAYTGLSRTKDQGLSRMVRSC